MAGLLLGRNRPNRFGGPLGLAASLPLLAASLVTPCQAATGAASQSQSAPARSPAAASSPSAATPTLQPGAPKPGVGKPGLAKAAAAPAPGSAAPTASQAPEGGAPSEPKVLISEVVVKGLQQHPERERLELAVYDAMATRPGTLVTRSELRNDLSAIYASGWFSDVRIQPQDGPLGVRLLVTVEPNPVLTKVEL